MLLATLDFPGWFFAGFYGGLISCLVAAVIIGLVLFKRQQRLSSRLAWMIGACILAALCLLPLMAWFQGRFLPQEGQIPLLEIAGVSGALVLCGWLVPLATSGYYCFFDRTHRVPAPTFVEPQSIRNTQSLQPPRYQPGVPVPFVISEETPWAWLEYRSGKFQGQRLALKRAIATIGRDEECDIWLDDDMASRYHAELAWLNGQVCLTDCGSLNGTRINGRRVRGSILITSNDLLEIGEHRFLFLLAESSAWADDDPLSRHTWRSTSDLLTGASKALQSVDALMNGGKQTEGGQAFPVSELSTGMQEVHAPRATELERQIPPTRSAVTSSIRVLRVCEGTLVGQSRVLNRPMITIGQGAGCDWQLAEPSLSEQHGRISMRAEGDYLEDLTGSEQTLVNDMPLWCPHLLKPGDIITLGAIRLEYDLMQTARTTPLPPVFTAAPETGPAPSTVPPITTTRPRTIPAPFLKLPSKPKENA